MAPRPYENNFRVRLSKSGNHPAIYAISSGPQKGVHMLSSEPLPPSLQYMYRHPINIHTTFLDVTGDFLRRRFDSIEAAQKWIDEMDALRRKHEAEAKSDEELADRLADSLSLSIAPTTTATAREKRRDPVYRGMPESICSAGVAEGLRRSEVLEGMRGLQIASRGVPLSMRAGGAVTRGATGGGGLPGNFRIGKRWTAPPVAKEEGGAGRYSRSHTGAQVRREVVGVLTRRHSEADVGAATAAVAAVKLTASRTGDGTGAGAGGGGCLADEEAVMMED